jgi:hypothetical protein
MADEIHTTVEWRPVVGHEMNYQVSSDGQVRSRRRKGARGGLLNPMRAHSGHLFVSLHKNNVRTGRSVHQIVAVAFIGPRPNGMEVRHLDGNPTNNRISNICYGSRSENQFDKVRHGAHHNANKTHCPYGHPYDDQNTYRASSGRRRCLICCRAQWDSNNARRKAARHAAKAERISNG